MSYANSGNGSVMQDEVEEIELAPSYYEKLAFSAKYRIVHIDQVSSQASIFREASTQLKGRFGRSRQDIVVSGIGG